MNTLSEGPQAEGQCSVEAPRPKHTLIASEELSAKHLVTLSDNPQFARGLSPGFAHYHSFAYLDLMKAEIRLDKFTNPVFWFETPKGERARAHKFEAVDRLLGKFVKDHPNSTPTCILFVPWIDPAHPKNRLHMPRHRWTQLLAEWRPEKAVVCTCKITPNNPIHVRYRVYFTGVKVRSCECQSKDLSAAPSPEFELCMMNLWCKTFVDFSESSGTCEYRSHNPLPAQTRSRTTRPLDSPSRKSACASDVQPSEALVVGAQQSPDSKMCEHSHSNPIATASESPQAEASSTAMTQAFPTDSKERQTKKKNEDKAKGIEREVKKKKKFVEDHHDDCGDDLNSIVNDINTYSVNIYDATDSCDGSDDETSIENHSYFAGLVDNCELFMFYGMPMTTAWSIKTIQLTNIDELLCFKTSRLPLSVDIAEVCGGEGRASQLAVRAHLKAGQNFDIVLGMDLCDRHVAAKGLTYFRVNNIVCAIMAPLCAVYGPISNLSWHLHPERMHYLERTEGRPIAEFCGEVALIQLSKHLSFGQEQPYPSRLYDVKPWPTILQHPRVGQIIYDRCRCGLKVLEGRYKGLHHKKRSTITASDPELLEPFDDLLCRGDHDHLEGDGHGKELSRAQLWTWSEAKRFVKGIQALKHRVKLFQLSHVVAFPTQEERVAAVKRAHTDGAPTRGDDPEACPRDVSTCKACKWYRGRDHWSHTREIGQCCYPYDEPWIPECEGCWESKPSEHPSHTGGEGCRHTVIASRRGGKRTGKHPREPARRANADLSAVPLSRAAELGQEQEDAVANAPESPQAEGSGGSSSSASGSRPPGRPEGSADAEQRERRSWRDTGSGPGHGNDWSHFDVDKILKVLKMTKPTECKLTLRKLHVRWFHATVATMTRLLKHAGIPQDVLAMIPSIVQTCVACRNWAQPLPHTIASVELPEAFNQQVEALSLIHI